MKVPFRAYLTPTRFYLLNFWQTLKFIVLRQCVPFIELAKKKYKLSLWKTFYDKFGPLLIIKRLPIPVLLILNRIQGCKGSLVLQFDLTW